MPIKIKQLVNGFADAIAEQSRESGISGSRSKSLLGYCVSPFSTMCMLTAMVLNRIVIFASSRRSKQLPTLSRVLVRLIAIFLLLQGSYGVFVALRVYGGPSTWTDLLLPSPYFDFDRATFKDKSFLGLYYSPAYFERKIPGERKTYLFEGPSTAILKPFYMGLCLSQVLETFVAATSGTKPAMETSLTLFEYSLAFQEVQGTDSRPTVELIKVALIALANQIDTHLLGLFNLQGYRLLPSSAIGAYTLKFCYDIYQSGNIFSVPFSVQLGYLPHLLSFLLLLLSGSIYLLAGLVRGDFAGLSVTTVLQNFSSINVSLGDDFYTALFNVSTFAINASGKQSYVVEAPPIAVPISTYLENHRAETCGYGIEEYPVYREMLQGTEDAAEEPEWQLTQRFRRARSQIRGFAHMLWDMVRGVWKPDEDEGVDLKPFRSGEHVHADGCGSDHADHFSEINLNLLDPSQVADSYSELLTRTDFADLDDSPDYVPKGEDDDDDVDGNDDGDDDSDDDDGDDNHNYNHNHNHNHTETRKAVDTFTGVVNPDEFLHLINPTTAEEISEQRILGYHLGHYDDKPVDLTRSKFRDYYTQDLKLVDVIREKRHKRHQDLENDELGTCVICHENSRQIILWPCKCLAICEKCRVSLYVRNFNSCVCCRSNVESYSKVYVP